MTNDKMIKKLVQDLEGSIETVTIDNYNAPFWNKDLPRINDSRDYFRVELSENFYVFFVSEAILVNEELAYDFSNAQVFLSENKHAIGQSFCTEMDIVYDIKEGKKGSHFKVNEVEAIRLGTADIGKQVKDYRDKINILKQQDIERNTKLLKNKAETHFG